MPLPDHRALLYVHLMMDRIRATVSLTLWILLIGTAVAGLHLLGSALPVGAIWNSTSSVDVAVGAGARLLGLAAGYWLLLTTLVYLLGQLVHPPAARQIDWATIPWVRRLADRISARVLVSALAAPLPLLDLVTPGYIPIPAGDNTPPATATTTSTIPVIDAPVIEAPTDIPDQVTPSVSIPAVPAADETVEVIIQRGDNMWKLAEARLQDLTGRPPTDGEIAPYWRRVVESNRDRIRSGDPDLIFPGEVLILPPP